MPLKPHASLDFVTTYTPAEKVAWGANVIHALTGAGGTFPSLHLNMAQLTDLNDNLQATIGPALGGDTHAIDMRNAALAAWDAGFRLTASDVDHQAQGDPAIITVAGFTATAGTRTPKGAPADAVLASKPIPIPGGLHIKVAAQKSIATAYLAAAGTDGVVSFQFAANTIVATFPGGKIYIAAATSSDIDITGIEADTKVTIAVRAINSAGAGGGATAIGRAGE